MAEPLPSARSHVFISYRRDDARGASGRLYDWLRIAFGREHVFRDVAGLGVGRWRDAIDQALARSAVCVAVIGPRWANSDNMARLRNPADLVRHELTTALADGMVTVVPALVEDASVPNTADLPTDLRPLFDVWNARHVRENGWEDDIRRLVDEIAKATGLVVMADLDALLSAKRELASLQQDRRLQADQLEALNHTVDELRSRLANAEPAQRVGLAAAYAALARGDSTQAEEAFASEYARQIEVAEQARRAAGEAARNVAHLATTSDLTRAVAFFRKSLEVDPGHSDTSRLFAHALMGLGDLGAAREQMEESLRLALAQADPWAEMAALGELSDLLLKAGDLKGAKAGIEHALLLAEQFLAADPDSAQRQRGLLLGLGRMGSAQMTEGDVAGALASYRKGLQIAEALSARDPANTEWQRDLWISHESIGNALAAQGDHAGALAAFRNALAVAQALHERDPAHPRWQRGVLVGYGNVGETLMAQGDSAGALVAFRASADIARTLTARDPANTEWRRDQWMTQRSVGDVLLAQGDSASALEAYANGLVMAEMLAAQDPVNAEWQRDLWVSQMRVGDAMLAQGNAAGAFAAYHRGVGIAESLAARDPANVRWQIGIAASCWELGRLDLGQGAEARRRSLLRGREILATLKSAERLAASADWITQLDEELGKLSQSPGPG